MTLNIIIYAGAALGLLWLMRRNLRKARNLERHAGLAKGQAEIMRHRALACWWGAVAAGVVALFLDKHLLQSCLIACGG